MVVQVQRAAAGALRTLAFKNEDNKNQIVECGALPTLIQMLRADDVGIHYEAVGVIGNLVHSSQHIKRKVLCRARCYPCETPFLVGKPGEWQLAPCRIWILNARCRVPQEYWSLVCLALGWVAKLPAGGRAVKAVMEAFVCTMRFMWEVFSAGIMLFSCSFKERRAAVGRCWWSGCCR